MLQATCNCGGPPGRPSLGVLVEDEAGEADGQDQLDSDEATQGVIGDKEEDEGQSLEI